MPSAPGNSNTMGKRYASRRCKSPFGERYIGGHGAVDHWGGSGASGIIPVGGSRNSEFMAELLKRLSNRARRLVCACCPSIMRGYQETRSV